MATFIGIKQIWYGDVITEDLTASSLATWLSGATEITNTHNDTYTYEKADDTRESGYNGLTGKQYYNYVSQQGEKTISFTVGQYDFDTLVALQGGELIGSDGWKSATEAYEINRAIVGKTVEGNYIVFTNARVCGNDNVQDKVLGIGVTATALETGIDGVSDEYRFLGTSVDSYTTA